MFLMRIRKIIIELRKRINYNKYLLKPSSTYSNESLNVIICQKLDCNNHANMKKSRSRSNEKTTDTAFASNNIPTNISCLFITIVSTR
mmetsp:Transcript_51154/g.52115  ORF Transcript_51154/g.52115 Transcript_51154/m.52115 type:complete len:88 (+) Transcript_51154:243-506(+)